MAAGSENELDLRKSEDGWLLSVRAQPGASRCGVAGIFRNALKVAVHAPPEKGAANKEIIQVIAKTLGVPRSRVRLVAGLTGRDKVVAVEMLSREELMEKLAEALRGGRA